jgi:hypothetical protein
LPLAAVCQTFAFSAPLLHRLACAAAAGGFLFFRRGKYDNLVLFCALL